MLTVISPAKTLDYESPVKTRRHSDAEFLDQSSRLIDVMRGYSPSDIQTLMGVSENLAELNHQRYMNWGQPFDTDNARQAVLAFKGDVYTGLDAASLSASELGFAQKHLRILSGLYGVLRPLDLMQPYRLEMGTRLPNEEGKDLYAFWGDQITDSINGQLKNLKSDMLVNLASNEYFRSVKAGQLHADIITPVFKDLKGDRYKVISFFAKKARGQMARYIIQNGITSVDDIQAFNIDGYSYNSEESDARELVFTRDLPPTAAGS